MSNFTITNPLPAIFHIQDVTGVCFTLLVGKRDTLLWDTGLGLYDVAACVAPLVRGKLYVILSHAHYDHACGHHYFDKAYIHPEDLNLCRHYVSSDYRKEMLGFAQHCGFLHEDFSAEAYLAAAPERVLPLTAFSLDLGGLNVQLIHTVGHTKGSMVAYVPDRSLLLTGDMWNPDTWLFFPESQPLDVYTKSMKGLRAIRADHVLCSHDAAMASMNRLRAYIDGLNAETFAKAEPRPIPPYTDIHTFRCHPEPNSNLVFNGDKREG